MRITSYKTLLTDDLRCTIVKEKGVNYTPGTASDNEFCSPSSISEMMRTVFQIDRQTEEHLFLLCFSTKMNLIGIFELSIGTINMSVASPREIFMKALLLNAARIVLVHNHPSGDVSPSKDDIILHKKIASLGEMMSLPLEDGIIIGKSYFSFRTNNLL